MNNISKQPSIDAGINKNLDNMSLLGKNEAAKISAIAVMMMVLLHFFHRRDWLHSEVVIKSVLGSPMEGCVQSMASFGDVCVGMFAMMSGYAIAAKWNGFNTYGKVLPRLLRFMVSYWIICALFLVVGYLNNDVLPNSKELMFNLVGLHTGVGLPWINVPYAWYVWFYILLMTATPWLVICFRKQRGVRSDTILATILFVVLFAGTGIYDIDLSKEYLTIFTAGFCSMIGIVLSKHNVFYKWSKRFTNKKSVLLLVLLLLPIIYMRRHFYDALCTFGDMETTAGKYVYGLLMSLRDVIISTYMLFMLTIVLKRCKVDLVHSILLWIALLSMYVWFMHGIIVTGKGLGQTLLYSLEEPLLIYFTGLILFIFLAWIMERVTRPVLRLVSKVVRG